VSCSPGYQHSNVEEWKRYVITHLFFRGGFHIGRAETVVPVTSTGLLTNYQEIVRLATHVLGCCCSFTWCRGQHTLVGIVICLMWGLRQDTLLGIVDLCGTSGNTHYWVLLLAYVGLWATHLTGYCRFTWHLGQYTLLGRPLLLLAYVGALGNTLWWVLLLVWCGASRARHFTGYSCWFIWGPRATHFTGYIVEFMWALGQHTLLGIVVGSYGGLGRHISMGIVVVGLCGTSGNTFNWVL
jgi:hypothetical protein